MSTSQTAAETTNKVPRRQVILFTPHTGTPGLDTHLQHIRNFDWSSTSLGPLDSWPPDLLQLCHVALLDPCPRLLILGPEHVLFYNEAYAEMCGSKHPHIIGQPVVEAWSREGEVDAAEAIIKPLAEAESSGRAVQIRDHSLLYKRNGFLEEVFLDWNIISINCGFFISLTDMTETRLAEKRRAALRALNIAWSVITDPKNFWQSVPQSLSVDSSLFPFAFLYAACPNPGSDVFVDVSPEPMDQMRFELVGAIGNTQITSRLPSELRTDHLKFFSHLQQPALILPEQHAPESWFLSSQNCISCPVRSTRSSKTIAFLFLGIDARRPYNEAYQEWTNELTRCLGSAATAIILAEEERRKQHAHAKQAAREQHLLATALATRDKEAVAVTDQFERITRVVDMVGVGIFSYDLDGKITYANDAWYELALKGYPKSSVSENKLSFLDITYSEEHATIMNAWNQLLKGIPVTFEMRYRSADGEGVWIQAACVPVIENGVVKSVSGCATNIHDTKLREIESQQRVQAVEKAKAWERRFVNFAEMAPVAIFFADWNTRSLTYCNKAWFSMSGHPIVPFDDIVWQQVIYEDDVELVRHNWEQIVTSKKSVSVQFRLKRRWIDTNGVVVGPIWVTTSALPEIDEDGSVKGIIGTMLDISALKFAERVEQIKAQEAMEAKRQQENFIDMVSHEIRNPLGAVVHCSDAVSDVLNDMTRLAKDLKLTSEHKLGKQFQELITSGIDSIGTIISCSAHQKRIVDDILVLSKLDSNLLQISPSAVQAVTLLRDVVKMFEAETERNEITLSTVADVSLKELDVDWVMLDPGRVQQVLINLVTNAIKFVKKRVERRVTVRMGASKERPSEVLTEIDFAVAHSLHDSIYDAPEFAEDTFYLWLNVQDTGTGMTTEEQRKIWNRFCQGSPKTYNEYGGSGLGLFISRELSELQGGEIGVASKLDVGSTFAFFIKTRHTEAPATAKMGIPMIRTPNGTLSRASTPTSTKLSVLVVEDNAVNQRVLKKQLTKHGYDVSVADNGQDALDFLATTRYWRGPSPSTASGEKEINVILMDVEMPIMDGITATKKIRELEADGSIAGHIPIIAVSANARAEQTMHALSAGMDDSISKPFRIADLVPKIDRLANWAKALKP